MVLYPAHIEGRLSGKTNRRTERDAAPAGEARHLALGSPRGPVRRHYDRLPSMAGRGGDEGRRKPPGSGQAKSPLLSPPGSTGPRCSKIAAARAPGGAFCPPAEGGRLTSVFGRRHRAARGLAPKPRVFRRSAPLLCGSFARAFPGPTQEEGPMTHVRMCGAV
jgi:hypothetical protein